MSQQIQQKQADMTTNYESAVEKTENEGLNSEIAELNQDHEAKVSVLEGALSPNQGKQVEHKDGNLQDQQINQEQANYQQFQDEPAETVQIPQNQSGFQQKPQDVTQSKNQQFDQFNEVEDKNQDEKLENNQQPKIDNQKLPVQKQQQPQIQQQVNKKSVQKNFAEYQNSGLLVKPQIQEKVQQKKEEPPKRQQKEQEITKQKGKKSKKKKQQQSQPLPIVVADLKENKKQNSPDKQNKKQESKKMQKQIKKYPEGKSDSNNNENKNNDNNNANNQGPQKQKIMKSEPNENEVSQIKQEVSEVVDVGSVAAGLIIFQAQRQRIASTLDYFLKFAAKHEKHTTSQKQLIYNIEDEIQKKKQAKTPLCNILREYFDQYINLCKSLYEKSYKYSKNQKVISANPMINMKEELKGGIDELIFLRKSTGNQFNRLGEFIANNPQKNVVKLFNDYWKAVDTAQNKHKEKKDEFLKKEKQFSKRIAKVTKVYSKGKQGVTQEEDLFIEMTKYINQQQDYRKTLMQYGQGLIPLKKAFIKAEQVLYEELQVIFNAYKNQFRTFYSLHPQEFTLIEKLQKQIREKNTFEKLSDITDGDYVRSVLLNHEKSSIQQLSDKQFEKVLGMVHFEEIIGNPIELLKGTTSKSFQLKNKTEQVVDTISGNLLIFNKQTAQMKEKFIIRNISAKIVQQGVVEIDEIIKGLIFNSNRTVRVTFRDNDRAEELICFLNQIHDNIRESQMAQNEKK